MSSNPKCLICGSHSLENATRFQSINRVTSDSRPWPSGGQLSCCTQCGAVQKCPTPEWLADIEAIYGSYDLYHQGAGAEQPIFEIAGTQSAPRSKSLVQYVKNTLRPRPAGALLDFGCGNGDALRSFTGEFSDWSLHGAELNDRNLDKLKKIPGFSKLHTCPIDEIDNEFDLITLIHSLEHVLDPVEILEKLSTRLSPDGHLFVEVPDCGANPYDLVIADHLLHFTLSSLGRTADRAGLDTVALTNEILPKELTWVGRVQDAAAAPKARHDTIESGSVLENLEQQLEWLLEQQKQALELAERSDNFGIFGTSISGTWLFGALSDKVRFFVDEDKNRCDREHMGRPVLAPSNVPQGADVYVPLIPKISRSVVDRLSSERSRYHATPDLAPFRF